MSKFLARVSLLAMLAFVVAGCNRDSGSDTAGANAGPQQTVQRSIELTRSGDIAGLIEHMLPPAEFARVKAEWSERKNEDTPSEEQRQKFAEMMAKLTAPDAVDTIYAEIEPDIRQFDAQYQKQMPTIVSMGRGYLRGLVQQSQELTASEKEQANSVIEALAQWVEKTRFTDPERVKKALAIISETARQLDLKTLDQARALDFDQSAPKMKIAFNGLKKVLEVYDFSVDQTLDSVNTELVSNEGDKAAVKISYTLLGTPLETRSEMVRIDDRWFARDTIDKLRERDSGQAALAPAASGG
ncbi:hypothetical protein [Dokdonella immobilis]|uniref:Uncharacterized protein n=1 Tax=Dokdonella immobilis TaxID=578942 RepID=A0A1I4VMK5_9GAMM|nr:hypothetical protein [Dokdonella immobilis]SFN02295.1 hypothetical protein SAMN05216289_102228 [Dokdonella immobilis]